MSRSTEGRSPVPAASRSPRPSCGWLSHALRLAATRVRWRRRLSGTHTPLALRACWSGPPLGKADKTFRLLGPASHPLHRNLALITPQTAKAARPMRNWRAPRWPRGARHRIATATTRSSRVFLNREAPILLFACFALASAAHGGRPLVRAVGGSKSCSRSVCTVLKIYTCV